MLEGVKVHNHEIDGRNPVPLCLVPMLHAVALLQQPAVHLGVKGFHPPLKKLRRTSVVGHVKHRQTGVPQGLRGSASRKQFHAESMKSLGEFEQARFI